MSTNLFRFRADSLVTPFREYRAGVPENDSENNSRFETGLENYLKRFTSKQNLNKMREVLITLPKLPKN